MKFILSRFRPFRRKLPGHDTTVDAESPNNNFFELSAVGFGACLGFGIYILIGFIVQNLTGPSAIVAFSISAVIAVFIACFLIEFIFTIPSNRASIVQYIHSTLGEFIAFIVGWNLILEYIIGAACVSHSFTMYFDSLVNGSLIDSFTDVAPMYWENVLSEYFDIIGLILPIIVAGVLALGLKRYGVISLAVTILNCSFIFFLIVVSIIKADASNWSVNSTSIQPVFPNVGDGGFLPFTISGTIQATSLCVFVFIGFDSIVTILNQKTIQDNRAKIPISFFLSLAVVFIIFGVTSSVFSLAWPYYQHSSGNWMAQMFEYYNWNYAMWISSIGALIALITCLFVFMYSLIPLLQSMAQDMIIFEWMGQQRTSWPKTPILGLLGSGTISGLLAALFSMDVLVKMLAIGTIITFLCLSLGVVVLRHSDSTIETDVSVCDAILQIFNCRCQKEPSRLSSNVVNWMLFIYCLAAIGLAVTLRVAHEEVFGGEIWAYSLASVFLLIMIFLILLISVQPGQPRKDIYFRVPIVTFLAGISIFLNIYLLSYLDMASWIRLGIWMVCGLAIYIPCVYARDCGVRNRSCVVPSETNSQINAEKTNNNVENGINEKPVLHLINERQVNDSNEIKEEEKVPEEEPKPKPRKIKSPAPLSPVVREVEETPTPPPPPPPQPVTVVKPTAVIVPMVIEEVKQEKANVSENTPETFNVEIRELKKVETVIEPEKPEPKMAEVVQRNDKETYSALEILDNVISEEEKRPPSIAMGNDFALDNNPSEEKRETKVTIVALKSGDDVEVKKSEEKSPDDFKKRLTLLLRRSIRDKTPKTAEPKSNDDHPALKHSKSETDLVQIVPVEIEDINGSDNDKKTGEEEVVTEEEVVIIPPPPPFDPVVFEALGKIAVSTPEPEEVDKNIEPPVEEVEKKIAPEEPPVVIPPPPKFDPVLYNTMGNKLEETEPEPVREDEPQPSIPEPPKFDPEKYNKSPVNTLKFHFTLPPSPKQDQKSLIRPKSPEPKKQTTLPPSGENFDRKALKQKLEMIFQKGPPQGFRPPQRPKRTEPNDDEETPKEDTASKTDDDIDQLSPVAKPFNTAKLRFSEVLKSIKSHDERRPSIVKTNVFQTGGGPKPARSSSDLENARSNLRHTVPPRQLLPET